MAAWGGGGKLDDGSQIQMTESKISDIFSNTY
jgi:hypothetical protein